MMMRNTTTKAVGMTDSNRRRFAESGCASLDALALDLTGLFSADVTWRGNVVVFIILPDTSCSES
jgi:hypothetical protein